MKKENNVSVKIGIMELGVTSQDMPTREVAALILNILEYLLKHPKLVKALELERGTGSNNSVR